MKTLEIGWHFGNHKWAFRHTAEHLKKAMPGIKHQDNADSDINVLFAPDQLKTARPNQKTILRIDGNRWYEK